MSVTVVMPPATLTPTCPSTGKTGCKEEAWPVPPISTYRAQPDFGGRFSADARIGSRQRAVGNALDGRENAPPHTKCPGSTAPSATPYSSMRPV